MLITGISGAEFGVRGFLDGWDPETGKKLWRRFTIPGPGEPGYDTWPQDEAYLRGGGSTWMHRLLRSAARPRLLGHRQRRAVGHRVRPGDNLYTAWVIAIRPKTGEIAWHYQSVPNECYDLDATWERILADSARRRRDEKVVCTRAAAASSTSSTARTASSSRPRRSRK